MPDFNELVRTMKETALDAVKSSRPTAVIYGKVTNESPLEVEIDQALSLRASQLILTRGLEDHEVDVTVDWPTGVTDNHDHRVTGRMRMTIHFKLKNGDVVALLQAQGGQQFIVLGVIA